MAVALWCGASYRLDPRDAYIGWDMKKREERLGLVVQLARFALVSPEHERNMASRALGCAMRAIGGHYRQREGLRAHRRRGPRAALRDQHPFRAQRGPVHNPDDGQRRHEGGNV